MTANDPSRLQEAVNHGDARLLETAIVGMRDQGTVDFDVFDQTYTNLRNDPRAIKYFRLAGRVLTALRSKSDSSDLPSRHIK